MYRIFPFYYIFLFAISFFSTFCGGQSSLSPSPPSPPPHRDSSTQTVQPAPCPPSPGEHVVYSIHVDGKDVGRDVRTDITEPGPLGIERVISSHSVTHMKMGQAHFETRTVRFQRTLSDSGILLKGSHVAMDQVTVRTFLVGYNGDGWDRLFESRSVVTDPLTADPVSLPLSGNEVIGLRLSDHLRNIVLGRADNSINISYYEPLLDSPVDLVISDPLPGITNLDGQEISGTWIESRLSDSDSVVVRSFFDKKGTLWVEEYPTIHQIRRRMPGPLSLSSETSELLVGLYSEAYVSDLNAATRAKYRLKSTPDRLDSLDLLGVPLNHKLVRESPDVLVLEVKAGAPDSDDPPNKKADLGASRYVQPNSKEIIGALRYLRSAGKRGRLTRDRRYNATPVVARASLIQRPKRFWSDPERVAGLIMHYVSALLPDKRHTFSMADAVTTLSRGSGDCTEHAVLFASLMRAHKIPTRLVAGMQLTRGGMWGYHMWNSYWNGSSWKSIDPSTMSYRPGALYVALGRGAAEFDELRDHLADFMWRTFTGVSFNLVEASNTGEKLFLARPRSPDQNVKEIALFNAVVLSERGDHEGAISVIDEHIPKDRRSLSIKLMRIELLVRSGKHDVALKSIDSLRDQTSDSQNTDLLDKFELKCLLTMGRFKRADEVYRRIDKQLAKSDSEPARTLLQAELLFGRKDESRAIELLEKALDKHPDNTSLLSAFAEYVTTSDWVSGDDLLERALKAAHRAANETLLSEHEVLATLARVLIRTGRLVEADRIIDHALILAPSDRTLHELRGKLPAKKCPLTIRKQQDN